MTLQYHVLVLCSVLLSSKQQASIERKDTKIVEAANSAASNQDHAILPDRIQKTYRRELVGCSLWMVVPIQIVKTLYVLNIAVHRKISLKEIFGEGMYGSTHHLITYKNLFSIT